MVNNATFSVPCCVLVHFVDDDVLDCVGTKDLLNSVSRGNPFVTPMVSIIFVHDLLNPRWIPERLQWWPVVKFKLSALFAWMKFQLCFSENRWST